MVPLIFRLEQLNKQITELEESLELLLQPPTVRIDESSYPMLDELRNLWAEADRRNQSGQTRQAIENQITDLKAERDRVQAAIKAKQERIGKLRAQQPALLNRFNQLQAEAQRTLLELAGLAQVITDEESSLETPQFPKPGVYCGKVKALSQSSISVDLLPDGRIILEPNRNPIVADQGTEFGAWLGLADCRSKVKSETKRKMAA
ncbi:hypothetical protein C7B61_00295 [filamentous cyanobacterium CCP1]|nr:hypothetical protein C7B76_16765 [filamentous cyanobacterium CCP2]PSB68538.1 hypothetical protein C7B61_00295 [filamentous cyanobacterium CCP1]